MKSFFEEYGFILVAVVVMVALIGIVGTKESGLAKTIGDTASKLITNMTPESLR